MAPSTARGAPPTVARRDLFPKTADQAEILRNTRAGKLWSDPDFPANNTSLFGKGGKGSPSMAKVSAWLRPTEFAPLKQGEVHKLVYGDAAAGDVIQGGLGDCYLLGALSTVAASHVDGYTRLKQNVLPSDGKSFGDPPEGRERGFFTFRFYVFGEWVQVTVDTFIPCGADRRPAFARCVDPRELWVLYLEKAYAKLHGSYAAIEGGSLTTALVDLTGGFAEEIDLRAESAQRELAEGRLWQRLLRYQRLGYLMGCAVAVPGGETEERTAQNLMQNHAYGLLLHYEQSASASADGEPLRLVKIRNPWGQGEWTGPWSDSSEQWATAAGKYARQQLDFTFENDGTFFMEFGDYASHMNTVYVCKILRDADWHRAELHDEWSTAAGTAGGCFNFPTWRSNPQWVLRVAEPTHAHFVLLQPDARVGSAGAKAQQSHTIGMYVMRGHERFLRRVLVNSDEVDGEEIVDSTDFVLRREVSCNTLDEEGEAPLIPGVPYVLVPSSFYPNKDGLFKLILYTQSEVASLERIPPLVRQTKRGEWRGRSAGGPEGSASWKFNPQFLMHARGATEDSPARVSIVLHRRDPSSQGEGASAKGVRRKGLASGKADDSADSKSAAGSPPRRGSAAVADSEMSFVVAHADPQHAHLAKRRTLRIPKRDVVNRAQPSRSAEVGSEFVLKEACTFVLVPSTGTAGQAGDFTIDVYSDQEVELEDVQEWTMKTVQGEWKGRSAGGCRNTMAWVANPMYALSAPAGGGGGGEECIVHCFVSQLPLELGAGGAALGEDEQPPALEGIGFYVIEDTGDLKSTPPAVTSGFYTAEEVGKEFALEAGTKYLLVPTTYRKGLQQSYTLQLFSEAPLDCRRLKPNEQSKLADVLYEEYAAGVLQRAWARYLIRRRLRERDVTRAKEIAIMWFSKPYRNSEEGYKDLNFAINALEAAFIQLTGDPSAHGKFFPRMRERIGKRGLKVADYDMVLPGPQD